MSFIDLSSRNLSYYTHPLFNCLLMHSHNFFYFFLSCYTTAAASYEYRHDRHGPAPHTAIFKAVIMMPTAADDPHHDCPSPQPPHRRRPPQPQNPQPPTRAATAPATAYCHI